jgi:hypothetical protein
VAVALCVQMHIEILLKSRSSESTVLTLLRQLRYLESLSQCGLDMSVPDVEATLLDGT